MPPFKSKDEVLQGQRFTHGAQNGVSHISSQINSELLKISDWLTVNILSLNVEKTKFMVFHNYQRVRANEDIPDLNGSHSAKIASKISCALEIMKRLNLILSHLQFGIPYWGFKWNRIFKLQKWAFRIITNSKYNAYTEPLLKEHMLKVSDIFNVQCMEFWYKFVNKKTSWIFWHDVYIQ